MAEIVSLLEYLREPVQEFDVTSQTTVCGILTWPGRVRSDAPPLKNDHGEPARTVYTDGERQFNVRGSAGAGFQSNVGGWRVANG